MASVHGTAAVPLDRVSVHGPSHRPAAAGRRSRHLRVSGWEGVSQPVSWPHDHDVSAGADGYAGDYTPVCPGVHAFFCEARAMVHATTFLPAPRGVSRGRHDRITGTIPSLSTTSASKKPCHYPLAPVVTRLRACRVRQRRPRGRRQRSGRAAGRRQGRVAPGRRQWEVAAGRGQRARRLDGASRHRRLDAATSKGAAERRAEGIGRSLRKHGGRVGLDARALATRMWPSRHTKSYDFLGTAQLRC